MEKFELSEFLLDDKNTTYLSSKTIFTLFSSLLGYGAMPGAPCSKAWPDYAVIGEVIYEPVH